MVGQFKKAYLHSHTRENSKMFNITLKYFRFFNNKPPASRVAHITRDFLTCYSCSYYNSMLLLSIANVLEKHSQIDIIRSSHSKMFFRCSQELRNIHRKTPVLQSLQLYYEETPTQVFSCKYSEILHSSFYIKHLRWLLLHNQDNVSPYSK